MKKFEFILRINGKIICQRYFAIKNFNPKIVNSINLMYCINECVEMVQEDLKDKSIDYLWNQYNPYSIQDVEQINRTPIYEKEDIFDFEIRIDEKMVGARRFTGNVYPHRVRYSVDIRDLIPRIINHIQEALSEEKISVEF